MYFPANRRIGGWVLAITFLLALVTRSVHAQPTFVITFDEAGSGSVFNGTFPNMPGQMTVDSTTGMTTLTYHIAASTSSPTIAGDVQITEPNSGTGPTVLSDLLRFDPNGMLFVYSDLEAGETAATPPTISADVGLPPNPQADPYSNSILMAETGLPGKPYNDFANGVFNYAPTAGQPGYIPGAVTIYNFYSDVPEPASVGLLATSTIAVLCRRRRASGM